MNMHHKISRTKIWGAILSVSLIVVGISLFSRTGKTSGDRGPSVQTLASEQQQEVVYPISKEMLSAQVGSAVRANEYPATFDLSVDGGKLHANVRYTLEEAAQSKMEALLHQYQPDYGAFVAIDAKTGRIISLVSYSREHQQIENLALRATFPAASIFKIVTASAALDLAKADPETIVPFNGANHTLYKRNVADTRENRWTRRMTMREAFARSVNVFFGKLGLFYVGPQNLKQYAERYNFNHPIRADIPVETGYAKFSPDDPWSVVTAASGFTRDNTMSPLQGALIASAVANDGVMMEPYVIESLTDDHGQALYKAEAKQASVVVEPAAAEKLRELFHETVRSGTSRKSFRQITRRSSYDDVEFGGKTGSLTGLNPVGKCDWFVGYARFGDQRIAVGALTVNEKKWRVKSSMLANLFFDHYIKGAKSRAQFVQNTRTPAAGDQ
jgi:peptidoglycan glycosyltransferase